jgi:hypothetical protein
MNDEERAQLRASLEEWAAESDLGECEGIGPDPTAIQPKHEEDFTLHSGDVLTPGEIRKLPETETDYTESPDF